MLPFLFDPLTRIHESPHHFAFARRALETGNLWHLVTDYVNHPPLINALAYGLLATLGGAPPVHRILPIVSFVVTAGLLTGIARELDASEPWPGVPALAFLFFPMIGYYWRRTGYEMVTVAFGVALVLLYLRWSDDATPLRLLGIGLVAALGALSDWAAPLYAGALFLDGWLLRPDGDRRRLGTAAAGGATIGVFAFWGLVLVGGDLGPLFERLLMEGGATRLGPALAAAELALWFVQMFTAVGVVLLLGPWILAGFQGRGWDRLALRPERLRGDRTLAALVLLGLPAVLYVVLFRHGAVSHRFWQLYFAPFLATSILAVGPLAPTTPGDRRTLEGAALILAAALVVAGATVAGFYALSWNIPSGLDAFDHVEEEAQEGAVVLLADAYTGKKGRWYIQREDLTLERWGRGPADRSPEAWVLYVEEKQELSFADELRDEGFALESTFPSETLASQWEVHAFRNTTG